MASLSFSRQIVLALVAGIACGLFFGELLAPLKLVADGFVRLLQMTVLPYVTLSIIASLGALDYAEAKRLGLRAGAVMLSLWAIAILFAFLVPLVFPVLQSGSFFSTTLIERRTPFNFLDLYIPANPFYSLAYNIVPAVVLFSVVLGIALIGVPAKQKLLEVMAIVLDMVSRATRFVVRLTPFGLFAIAAHSAGVMSLDQLERIQIYLIAYVAVSLLLALWVLPRLVSALTPISYRDLLGPTKDALATAFIAGDLFIVLPILTEACEGILSRHGMASVGEKKSTEVIIPASFNFPHTGKLLSLSFVLFAGWFSNAALEWSEYPRLAAAGLLSFFGSLNSAVPFLLDIFRIPADTFQLFLATGVINSRFGTLLAAVHTVVIAVLGGAALAGRLEFRASRLVRYGLGVVIVTLVTLGGLRVLFSTVLAPSFQGAELIHGIRPLHPHPESIVLRGELAQKVPASSEQGVVADLRARGVLRVGFFPNRMPYTFFNRDGKLVGLDVEMAHALAREFGVRPEFIELPTTQLTAAMSSGLCDIIMTGAMVTPRRMADALFSRSYLDETLSFVVRDFRRHEFATWEAIRQAEGARIAVPNLPHYLQLLAERLPRAILVPVNPDYQQVTELVDVDALAMPAERGAIQTLLHPEFSVVVPEPDLIRMPMAYPVARMDREWAEVVNTWIELKQKDGTLDALRKHWVLGQTPRAAKPRWSILGNVLGWTRP